MLKLANPKFRVIQHPLQLELVFDINNERGGVSTRLNSVDAIEATKCVLIEAANEILEADYKLKTKDSHE